MQRLILQAPAKINYRLDVIRRRDDGYHELRMIMQQINLCDEIAITLTDTQELTVSCGAGGVPDGPGNIAWKAARAMLDLAATGQGADISINKRIPVAAGLGGGSSDAASVLMGMNHLLGCGFSTEQLMDIGLKLGADVPFFIFGRTALATGIGEKLSEISAMPKAWILLVNPGIRVSTAWVYRNLKLTNRSKLSKLPEFFSSVAEICDNLSNDLESVTIPSFPVIAEIRELMLSHGARGAMMSGSGPTVFGVFEDETSARHACDVVTTDRKWFSALVETL